MPKWTFRPLNPDDNVASGDYSKVFQNESVKAPGIFSTNPPDDVASLLVREAVQNAWDSALEMRDKISSNTPVPEFKIEFKFRTLRGEERYSFIKNLGLKELSDRAELVGKEQISIEEKSCLLDIDDKDSDLNILEIVEHGTGGMYGPWTGTKSKLFQALCSFGFTEKSDGSGGSFGYGKAGLIGASSIRCIVAYTCFSERKDDPGVTRKLLGATYWNTHQIGDHEFPGHARFGKKYRPFNDEEADKLAQQFGIHIRSSDDPSNIGSSILVIDPKIEPNDVVRAVERYWWPALKNKKLQFSVSVTDYSSRTLLPDPDSQEDLISFIEAYNVITTNQLQIPEDAFSFKLKAIKGLGSPGTLGLVLKNPGWSFPDSTDKDIRHCSLVALVRVPHMIVEYYTWKGGADIPPFVRGVFVASESVNNQLRLTEPKTHDAWQTKSTGGKSSTINAKLADNILSSIRGRVNVFRKENLPDPKPSTSLNLPVFDRYMRRMFGGSSPGKNPPKFNKRMFSITPGQELRFREPNHVQLAGLAKVSFSDYYFEICQSAEPSETIRIKISYNYLADEEQSSKAELAVDPPLGFSSINSDSNIFIGNLTGKNILEFEYESEEYDLNWTGSLSIDAEIIET